VIDASAFEALRPYLFSVAYRMLGSASEAEDVVQDAWLRTRSAPEDVQSPKAWLSTVVTRLCLDRLKSGRATREQYVGPWLPEPVPTVALAAQEETALRHESVQIAFLVLLETLTPAERAAFLLREVFDYGYAEVAEVVGTSEAACRQLVHRAKERIARRRPVFRASRERQQEIVDRFLAATSRGDLDALQAFLARDVTFVSDGGGRVPSAMRPVVGPVRVARLFAGLAGKAADDLASRARRVETSHVNGEPAMLVFEGPRLESVFVFTIEDDRIAGIRVARNPDKLAWMARRLAGPVSPGPA
jgi:RNA polymerase sigma-70 factor, ECF subfamily